MRVTTTILAGLLLAATLQASAQQPGNDVINSQQPASQSAAPQPFVATYDVSYRGIGAGTLTFTLARDPTTGHYTYETSANPSMLARFVIGSAALERSVMEIGPQGVRPLEWHFDNGKSGSDGDGMLRFDWNANQATGKIEGKDVDLPLEPGVQDRQSMQISVATALLRGQEPGTISLIDDNRVKRYNYERKRTETLDSKLGKLDTVVYESTREGSNRLSRFWLVPKLEFVAARAEQVRKGKVETVMVLIALEQK